MADTVETTVQDGPEPQAPAPSSPVKATPAAPDIEAQLKAARLEAKREAQASKDREFARLQRQHQQEIAAVKQAAKAHMTQLGDQDSEQWDRNVTVYQKASAYDELLSERQAWDAWNAHVGKVAAAHGLEPGDARLAGAVDDVDLKAKAERAMTADVTEKRRGLLAEAEAAKQAAVDSRIASGALDTLGVAAAGANNETIDTLTTKLKKLNPVTHRKEHAAMLAELKGQLTK